MKDKIGRIICTDDVIVYALTGRSSSIDIYYVLDGYNDGDKIRVLMVNPGSLEIMPETNVPRMFSTGNISSTTGIYIYRPMTRDEIQHLLKTGTSHRSIGVNAYIINDDYAQEVKRFINAYR